MNANEQWSATGRIKIPPWSSMSVCTPAAGTPEAMTYPAASWITTVAPSRMSSYPPLPLHADLPFSSNPSMGRLIEGKPGAGAGYAQRPSGKGRVTHTAYSAWPTDAVTIRLWDPLRPQVGPFEPAF